MFKKSLILAILVSGVSFGEEAKKENKLLNCVKETIPEGLISAGLYAAILNPVSLAVSLGYYGNTLYKCNQSFDEKKFQQDLASQNESLKTELSMLKSSMDSVDSKLKNSEELGKQNTIETKKYVDDTLEKVKAEYKDVDKKISDYTENLSQKKERVY